MKPIRYLIIFLMLVPLACKKQANEVPVFVHDIAQGPKPWTGETFKGGGDDFTFAIISDLNGGERQGVFNVAVAQINRLKPTFVLSIGDLIDGGTEDMATL
ncbi:MAG TPA: metallophosphatase family protein, partial [Flavobacteriia bacterium]|nr:metallophosphatase family protein [Flavobacteriia bacterium]